MSLKPNIYINSMFSLSDICLKKKHICPIFHSACSTKRERDTGSSSSSLLASSFELCILYYLCHLYNYSQINMEKDEFSYIKS